MKNVLKGLLSPKIGATDLRNRTAWLQLDDNTPYPVAGPCSIGRAKTNTVAISSEKVSRLHALVHVQDRGAHWLVDLGSCNGTYLNGQRVVQPVRLEDEDVILVGDHRVRFFVRAAGTDTDDALLEEAQMTVRETREVPCWFLVADIANFVSLSASMSQDEMAQTIGEWLAASRLLIHGHRGTINQYLGDGFLGYWDGRQALPGIVWECFQAMKQAQKASKLPFRLTLHFGKAVVGGSPAMGDAGLFGPDVNFAFRMDKLAKALAVDCMLSQQAYEAFDQPEDARSLGMHPVPGLQGSYSFFSI